MDLESDQSEDESVCQSVFGTQPKISFQKKFRRQNYSKPVDLRHMSTNYNQFQSPPFRNTNMQYTHTPPFQDIEDEFSSLKQQLDEELFMGR